MQMIIKKHELSMQIKHFMLDKNLFIVDKKSVYELTREFYLEILTDEDRRDHIVHN